MATIDKLPAEVILATHTHLDHLNDLWSLTGVCGRLYHTPNLKLYRRDVQTGSPQSLFLAARLGLLGTLEMSYVAGANLEQAWVSDDSIFPKTCRISFDEMSTTPVLAKILKADYVKHFKHSPKTYTSLFNEEKPSPPTSNDFNDNYPSALKTASKDCLMSFHNKFLERSGFMECRSGDRWPRYWCHALDLAVAFHHIDIIRYLLDNGVNVANSHSRSLCSRKWPCAGLRKLHACDGISQYPKRVHNPLTLAVCQEDLVIQKMLLEHLRLNELARNLSRNWEKIGGLGYRMDKFVRGSEERKILSTFLTCMAEVPTLLYKSLPMLLVT